MSPEFLFVVVEGRTLGRGFDGGAGDEKVGSFTMGLRSITGARAVATLDSSPGPIVCCSSDGGDVCCSFEAGIDVTVGCLVAPSADFFLLDPESDFLFFLDCEDDVLVLDSEEEEDCLDVLLDFPLAFFLVGTAAGFLVATSSSSSGFGRDGGFGGAVPSSSSSVAGGSLVIIFSDRDKKRLTRRGATDGRAFARL